MTAGHRAYVVSPGDVDQIGIRGERVYLAGPMTGLPEYNYPAFHTAAYALRSSGIPVHCPSEVHDGRTDLPMETYLRAAVIALAKCAAVVLLPGYEHSPGVRVEMMTAKACGIPAYEYAEFMAYVKGRSTAPVEVTVAELDTPRASLLNEARDLVTGDRNNAYGPPTQDFARSAGMLTALGFTHNGEAVRAHHIAMIIACVKLARLTWSPDKRDSWADLAGYAGCGYECAVTEEEGTEHGTSKEDRGSEGAGA